MVAGTAALSGAAVPARALTATGSTPAAAQSIPNAPVTGSPLLPDWGFSARALLPDGGFDAGDRGGCPMGWSVTGNANAAKIVNLSADRTAGLCSLQIDNPGGSSVTVLSDYIIATSGTRYTVQAQLKGASGTPASLSIQFAGFDGTVLGTATNAPPLSTSWQTVTVQGTAPVGSAHLTISITASDAGVSYWDQVTLTVAEQAPYDPALGAARELFLDDYRIGSVVNAGRMVHPASKQSAPVLKPDQPWEGTAAYIYGSVYKIGALYRMWYTCVNDVSPGYFLCYAESQDGVRWTKPTVGTIGYHDIPAGQTNMVLEGGGTVAYNPAAPADRRYAALVYHSGVVNVTLGYYAYFSPDGYHWTLAQSAPVLLDGDVSNVTWDPGGRQYIASIKKRMFTSRTPGIYNRSAFIAASKDFLTWTTPHLGVGADDADNGAAEAIAGLEGQIYGMPVLPYESIYVGLPWVFLITDYTTGASASAGDGPVAPQVACSRDLATWSRPVRDYILCPGGPGAWDSGTCYTASNALVDGDNVNLYYGGFNVWHGGIAVGDPSRATQVGQVGLATWRRDGFVSITNNSVPGAGTPGTVTTKPVTISGSVLHVNCDVHPAGSLVIDILDPDTGDPLPGFTSEPVNGDRLDARITWPAGATLAGLQGKPVRLRFTLAGADLYSYWVTDLPVAGAMPAG